MLATIPFGFAAFACVWFFKPGFGVSVPTPALEIRAPEIRVQGTVRSSLHAVPLDDFKEINASNPRRVPDFLKSKILHNGQPTVLLFLKADCGCSLDFARIFNKLAPILNSRAYCLAVVEGNETDVSQFLETSGLTTARLTENVELLATEWGVKKAGAVVLVRPNGDVEVAWPGISRQSFRDLAQRLGEPGLFQDSELAEVPGASTAGCPLGMVR